MEKKKRQQTETQLANLKMYSDLTAEQKHNFAVAGGKASAAAKKEKKRLKEALLFLLDNVDAEGLTGSQKICMALYREALNGNVQAFNTLRDTTGEIIKQQQEINIERPNINIGFAPQKITSETTKLIASKPDESKDTGQTDDVT